MKHLSIHILLLSSLLSVGYAQEKHSGLTLSVGADAAYLLRQLGAETDSGTYLSPYLVHLQLQAGRIVLRAGVGGAHESGEVTREGFSDSEVQTTQSFAARFGLGYALMPGHRWQAQVGLDVVFDFNRDKLTIDSGFDEVSRIQQDQLWGGGIFMGIGYQLNDHLSLFTEASIYYLQGSSQISRQFANFPSFDDTLQENTINRVAMYLPARIYLLYTF